MKTIIFKGRVKTSIEFQKKYHLYQNEDTMFTDNLCVRINHKIRTAHPGNKLVISNGEIMDILE